jgi:hypothetical protein
MKDEPPPNDFLTDVQKQARYYTDVQKQARYYGLNVAMSELMLQKLEEEIIRRPLSKKYKVMYYLASTGLYAAKQLAEMFVHSKKNINADFNKNLGVYLKLYLELDDDERLGITSLRRILFLKGYVVKINDDNLVDVLAKRYDKNSELEVSSSPEKTGMDETAIN